jgi:cell wall-associated NlpC family hydrolase
MIHLNKDTHIKALATWEIKANIIIATGRSYLGTPYQFGARPGQTRTFDCSSFTQYIFGVHGIKLPRVSRQQSRVGQQAYLRNVRKGDLLFFTTNKRRNLTGIQRIGHVGVYIGNNQYISSFSPQGVNASRRRAFITARRVIF